MKFNLTAHKELWNWLADNPNKGKINWPGWKRNGGIYDAMGSCFACEYDKQCGTSFFDSCEKCPIVWGGIDCQNLNSPYFQWVTLLNIPSNYKRRSKLARQIANLPVREGVECE